MTDRERLGLPNSYVEFSLSKAVAAAYGGLLGIGVDELHQLFVSPGAALAERIACGDLLGLAGDRRLVTHLPEMMEIAGGEIEIGLPAADVDQVLEDFSGLGLDRSWIQKECPRHKINIPAYRIAKYPVTHQEYRDFLLATGYPELPSSWNFRQFPQALANHPVYTISPVAVEAYIAWLVKTTGRKFRLPSEAEWEWAAAGAEAREFPWGAGFDPGRANTAETGLMRSTPVGAFVDGASPFGLMDMAGNVEEYVADNYAAYPGGEFVADHLIQIHGEYRVARGGSFARFRDLARTRRRHGHNPRSATYAMGFRLAESI